MPTLRRASLPRLLATSCLLPAVGLIAACGADATSQPVASRIDLNVALGITAAQPVGVAVDVDGSRLVLDSAAGLVRLDAAGHGQVVLDPTTLPTTGLPLELPITDLVALGDGRFALTAIGDGYVLDLGARTLAQFFCYVPDGLPVDERQRTDAVAFDPVAGRLYAQPRTTTTDGTFVRSEVSSYDSGTGADLTWDLLPGQFTAGGMVAPGDGSLVLGAGTTLHRYDLATAAVTPLDDLARFGVGAIDGLALDPAGHTLIIVDAATASLVEIALDDLTL